MADDKMSDVVPEKYKQRARQLSEEHVNWFMKYITPLMRTEFEHGYRHGFEDGKTEGVVKDLQVGNWVFKGEGSIESVDES